MIQDIIPSIDRYSGVLSTKDFRDFTSGNVESEYGIQTSNDIANIVLKVSPNSNAAKAGLKRGDKIISTVQVNSETINLTWESPDENISSANITKSSFLQSSVFSRKVVNTNSGKVGYLAFTDGFIEPSLRELDEAFSYFKLEGGVDELIVDLRLNGGGYAAVADALNLYIAGSQIHGQISQYTQHNSNLAKFDHTIRFGEMNDSIGFRYKSSNQILNNSANVSRVIILTNGGTASASERVINNLRPHIPVIIIGSKTYGKPVGSYGSDDFCEETLLATNFEDFNSDFQNDYYQGFEPNCAVDYQLPKGDWGSEYDPEYNEAIFYVENNHCSVNQNASSNTAARPSIKQQAVPTKALYIMQK